MKTRNSERVTVSVEPEVLQAARVLARQSGYPYSFSAYLNDVLRREIQCHVLQVKRPELKEAAQPPA
jgi:hypothetical protein